MSAMYPSWVFYVVGVASVAVLLAACAAVVAAFAQRWALTRRLSGWSFIAGAGIVALAIAMIVLPRLLGIDLGSGPESRATRLAVTLSALMNATVVAIPGLFIGVLTWIVESALRHRRSRRS